MHVIHIVAGLPPEGGGLSELVPRMAAAELRLGHQVTLVTRAGLCERLSCAAADAEKAGVGLLRCAPSWPGSVFFSWQMLRALRARVRQADVVHVHGNWTFPVWWACRCAVLEGKPLVMSPQGSFDPVRLRHSAWKKRLAGWLDRACLRRATVIHATAACEREWVMAYLAACDAEIVVIQNGVGSTNELMNSRTNELPRDAERTRKVLYLGRLHPLKGLDLLVEAWGLLRPCPGRALAGRSPAKLAPGLSGRKDECKSLGGTDDRLMPGLGSGRNDECKSKGWADDRLLSDLGSGRNDECKKGEGNKRSEVGDQRSEVGCRMSVTNELPPWRLVIAGPDEQGTLKALKEQAARLGLEDSVVFAGPVYGEEKWRLLRSADLFVLPTRSENFGIVVAEALAAGVPVVCTKGAPWEELLGYCDHAPGARLPDGVRQSLRRGLVVAMTSVKRDARLGAGSCRAEEVVAMTSVKIEEGRCGWWVDVDAEPLAEALREAMTLTDAERREMGENGRRLVEAKYRWESVARDMCRVYEGIIATMPRARACRTESGKASAGA